MSKPSVRLAARIPSVSPTADAGWDAIAAAASETGANGTAAQETNAIWLAPLIVNRAG